MAKIDLDGVANIDANFGVAPIPYDRHKGNCEMDGVESIESDSSLTYKADPTQRTGPAVELDAVTAVDGSATQTDMMGGTGTVDDWPRGWGRK